MSFKVQIGVTDSPNNEVRKNFTSKHEYDCQMKEESSILNPVIIIHTTASGAGNLSGCNYMYISEFGRYYYITDIISVRATIVEIHGKVDPLKSWAKEIRANSGYILRTAKNKYNTKMLDDSVFKINANPLTVVKAFNGTKFNNFNYIAIINGGTSE